MKTYQDFEWSESEELGNMNKQMIIQRMQNRHGFVVYSIGLFLVMLPIVFINSKREYSVFFKAGMNRTNGL